MSAGAPPIFLILAVSLAVFLLIAFGGALVFSGSSNRKFMRQRMSMYVQRSNQSNSKDNRADMRRKQINNKLKALNESKRHSKSRYGAAQVYLVQAGLDMPLSKYWLMALTLGLVATVIYYLMGYNPLGMPVIFLLFTYIVPRKILKRNPEQPEC